MEMSEAMVNMILEQNKQLLKTIDSMTSNNTNLLGEVEDLKKQNFELLSQLAWLKRQLFGRKSEKLEPYDLHQLEIDFGDGFMEKTTTDTAPAAEEAQMELNALEAGNPAPKQRKNRQPVDDKSLPVETVVIEPVGIDMDKYKFMGEEHTRELVIMSGKVFVRDTVRKKYGLKDNTRPAGGDGKAVIIPPMPLTPVNKCMASASLLAEILLQKYVYHNPFYRQHVELQHMGVEISESTIDGWFKPACELLRPLYEELRKVVLSADYDQCDETVLPVIDHQKKKAEKEYLWTVRAVMLRLVFFYYDKGSRSSDIPRELFKNFTGYLQCDGHPLYDIFEDSPTVTLVSCLAHQRRKYEESKAENEKDADYALKQIQDIYKVERIADENNLSYEQRAELRRKYTAPILDNLEAWSKETHARKDVLPKSRTGKATAYMFSMIDRIRPCLKDGRLLIDNNLIENAIRPIALSRKNFLFCGNHEAAQNMAVVCSLLASCKQLDVNPRQYLNDVTARMPYYQALGKDLRELLPDQWKPGDVDKLYKEYALTLEMNVCISRPGTDD